MLVALLGWLISGRTESSTVRGATLQSHLMQVPTATKTPRKTKTPLNTRVPTQTRTPTQTAAPTKTPVPTQTRVGKACLDVYHYVQTRLTVEAPGTPISEQSVNAVRVTPENQTSYKVSIAIPTITCFPCVTTYGTPEAIKLNGTENTLKQCATGTGTYAWRYKTATYNQRLIPFVRYIIEVNNSHLGTRCSNGSAMISISSNYQVNSPVGTAGDCSAGASAGFPASIPVTNVLYGSANGP